MQALQRITLSPRWQRNTCSSEAGNTTSGWRPLPTRLTVCGSEVIQERFDGTSDFAVRIISQIT